MRLWGRVPNGGATGSCSSRRPRGWAERAGDRGRTTRFRRVAGDDRVRVVLRRRQRMKLQAFPDAALPNCREANELAKQRTTRKTKRRGCTVHCWAKCLAALSWCARRVKETTYRERWPPPHPPWGAALAALGTVLLGCWTWRGSQWG